VADNLQDVARRLAASFGAAAACWKPMKVSGRRRRSNLLAGRAEFLD
jgi:hypothetical protein